MRRVLVVLTLVCGLCPASPEAAPNASQNDRTVETILAKARSWAGGPALERMRSLRATGMKGPRGQTMHPYEVRMLRPDRFQVRQEGWIHTMEGTTFWMVVPPDFKAAFSAEMEATARRSATTASVSHMVMFFLRVPSGQPLAMTGVGRVDIDGLAGDGVRVALEGRKSADTFIFDPASGQPLGYIRSAIDLSKDPSRVVVVFADYREVSGARFPTRIEERYQSGGKFVDWRVADLTANELGLPDFQKAGKLTRARMDRDIGR